MKLWKLKLWSSVPTLLRNTTEVFTILCIFSPFYGRNSFFNLYLLPALRTQKQPYYDFWGINKAFHSSHPCLYTTCGMLFFPATDCQLDSPSSLASASNTVPLPDALLLLRISTAFLSPIDAENCSCLFPVHLWPERDLFRLILGMAPKTQWSACRAPWWSSPGLKLGSWTEGKHSWLLPVTTGRRDRLLIPFLPFLIPSLATFPYQHLKA